MFNVNKIFEAFIDFLYNQVIGLFAALFKSMNEMGVNLFDVLWIKQIVTLFQNIGWALFATGLVIAVFEFAIESQGGRGDLKSCGINVIKGFMAVNLFTVLPVQLYAFALNMQANLSKDMTKMIDLSDNGIFTPSKSLDSFNTPAFNLFLLIMVGYAVVKVFFDSLKRGGILLIQMAVGSLYMLSVVRGFADGFTGWCKQVIAICVTAFLQSTMLVAGLLILPEHIMLGTGVMLAAGEIPRIAGNFGLETSTRMNISSAVYTAQGAIGLAKTIGKAVK